MDITPLIAADRQVIQSYGPGYFKISGVVHKTPIIVFPDRTVSWTLAGVEPAAADFEILGAAGSFDVVLLGSADLARKPQVNLRAALKARGFVLDVMDAGAACRTYNVLMSEGRRVAAALVPL